MNAKDIAELAVSFQESRVFLTGYELGIFTVVGRGGKSSSQVARKIGTQARYTDRLMNALCALGLLKKKGRRFRNSPLALKYLLRGSPYFMHSVAHSVNMWDTWSGLTRAIRSGKPVLGRGINERGSGWLEAFIAAMHERARESAPSVAKMIGFSLKAPSVRIKVLDVGGGSGAYAMAFVKAAKGITADVFDLPNVVPLAQNYIKKAGLSNKVKVVVGDYNADALGSGYDAVFLSAIIHINSPQQNRALFRKACSALRENGRIIIQDFIMNEDRLGPPMAAFFALNMLVATGSGDTYTESEVRDWLIRAGFSGIVRKDTGFGTALLMGRKRSGRT